VDTIINRRIVMGLFGPPNVDRLKAKNDVRGLIKALRYKPDRGVRAEAANALYGIGPKVADAGLRLRAEKALFAALMDDYSPVRTMSTGAMLEIGRTLSSGAILKIGSPAFRQAIASLKDRNSDVRERAAGALGKIGLLVKDAALRLRAIDPLIAVLEDASTSVRKAAAGSLGRIGAQLQDAEHRARIVTLLIAVLKDREKDVRQIAVLALGWMADSRAVEPLIAALRDVNKDVRDAAAGALDKFGWLPGQDEAGAAYWAVRREWDKCVEIGALAIGPLVIALQHSDRDVDARRDAAGALGRIGEPLAVPPLISALKDGDNAVREMASNALVRIGIPAITPLVAALKGGATYVHVREAAGALGKIGIPAIPPLIAALKDGSYNGTRAMALAALVKIGVPAVEPLGAALSDADWGLRTAAADALDKIGWQPGRDATGAAYWIGRQKWDTCVEIGAPALAPLLAVLKYDTMRRHAILALGQIGDSGAVDPLVVALMDAHKDVRVAAADALEKIGWQPGQDEPGAAYWVIKEKWDKCVELGLPAIPALIAALDSDGRTIRQSAAGALLQIYPNIRHDEAMSSLIQGVRTKITEPHSDRNEHRDQWAGEPHCAVHTNRMEHYDAGIGVDFPL
jgi:HEAT repeat protein